MKKLLFILLLFSAILSVSCSKEHGHGMEDEIAPTLSITSPQEGATYRNGDTIHIKYIVTENASLHELKTIFCNMNTKENSMDCSYHVHNLKNYETDTFCIAQVSTNTEYELKISAEDHSHNKTSKTVKVNCLPQ